MEDISSLTLPQKDLLNTIENLQMQQQKTAKKKSVSRSTEDEGEDIAQEKNASCNDDPECNHVSDELRSCIYSFFEMFDEITSPNTLSESVSSEQHLIFFQYSLTMNCQYYASCSLFLYAPQTKEALDDRLFDENDAFYDRSVETETTGVDTQSQ